MNIPRLPSALMLPLFLTGCDEAVATSLSAADLTTIKANAATYSSAAVTDAADLPVGFATYNGYVYGTATGDAEGTIAGSMSLTAGFSLSTLEGSISGLNLFDTDGNPLTCSPESPRL